MAFFFNHKMLRQTFFYNSTIGPVPQAKYTFFLPIWPKKSQSEAPTKDCIPEVPQIYYEAAK